MPIQRINVQPKLEHLSQVCAVCGAQHRISLDRGAVKTRTGPIGLSLGDTLVIAVDGGAPQTVTVGVGDLPDLTRITVAELASWLGPALHGAIVSDDAGGLLIESATTGADSRIEVIGGTARAALGLAVDRRPDPCSGRPVLGLSLGPHQDPNVIALRRCSDCGAYERLMRTFDAAPPELEGAHFAEHRKAINTLAEYCKACGWSHPELAAIHAAETVRPVDLHPALPESIELPKFVPSRPTGDQGAR